MKELERQKNDGRKLCVDKFAIFKVELDFSTMLHSSYTTLPMRLMAILLPALFGASQAFAGFVELTGEVHAISEYGTTYRIYATFDDPGDEAIAIYSVGSNEFNPVALTTEVSTSFYQHPAGANFASGINPFFFGGFPELIYDSWLTIGSEDAGDAEVSRVGMTAAMEDFAAGNGFSLDGGSWYITPGSNPLALAGEDLKVLLAQFTITDDGVAVLNWNMQWDSATDGNTYNELAMTFSTADIAEPIPGCMDSSACNFDETANTDDGSCILPNAAACEFCDGGDIAIADADGDGVCDGNEIPGCEDETACNFDEAATEDDGSCEFLTCAGCTDSSACNYDATATIDDLASCIFPNEADCEFCSGGAIAVADADGDDVCDGNEIPGCDDAEACNYNAAATDSDESCIYAEGPCDECSGATDGTGTVIDNDADNDGTCNADEVGGCTDETACNFDASATEDNGLCEYADGNCEACEGGVVVVLDADADGICDADEVDGCTDAAACNFNGNATEDDGTCYFAPEGLTCDEYCPAGDWDGDGICDLDEVPGCTSTSATNYDANATDEDGSCVWGDGFFEGLSVELVAVNGVEGMKTYRVYANFNTDEVEVAAAFGTNEHNWSIFSTELFYQDPLGGLIGPNINPLFFPAAPGMQYDTWLTLGAEPGDANDVLTVGLEAFFSDFATAGTNVLVDTEVGASLFYTPGASDFAFPEAGQFLLGQFTTAGVVSLTYNLQFRDPAQSSIQVTDLNITFPMMGPGCMDETACNYDADATEDDGSCTYAAQYEDCNGNCLNDADSDQICDELEIAGCTASDATNFDPSATDDDGSCLFEGCTILAACNYDADPDIVNNDLCIFPDPFTDCDGTACGGDWDLDGILEGDEIYGCASESATNFNPEATQDDGSCAWPNGFLGLEYEVAAENGVTGQTTYLVYARFDPNANIDAISAYGNATDPWMIATTSSFFQAALGVDFGGNLNPGLYSFFPILAYDTWMTLGAEPGDFNALAQTGMYDYLDSWNNGGDFLVDTDPGASIFLPEGSSNQGYPDADGRLLLAQLTTDGIVSLQYNLTFENAANEEFTVTDVELSFPDFVGGCTDETADNYDSAANFDDCSCLYSGCTNAEADNYDAQANVDDASCLFTGCSDASADNYWPLANTGDQALLCEYYGCTDESADNFDPQANVDPDDACEYYGCMDSEADNFDPTANVDPNDECEYLGCTEEAADNYDPQANVNDGSCEFLGCTNQVADNYDAQANVNDGSCLFTGCFDNTAFNFWPLANTGDQETLCEYDGCTDPEADNFDPAANVDPNDVCIYIGCTNPDADNYDATANEDDGSCVVEGCIYATALNYNPAATYDLIGEGTDCAFAPCVTEGCTDAAAANFNENATQDDGSCLFPGCMDDSALNYDPAANLNAGCDFGENGIECLGDLSGDLNVDVQDLLIFFQVYGNSCEQ